VAQPGDTILVANGVYTGSAISGFPSTRHAASSFGPWATGELHHRLPEQRRRLFLVGYEPPELIIEGFTIINGSNGNGAPFSAIMAAARPFAPYHSAASGFAGRGHSTRTQPPTFINCNDYQNTASFAGGGVFAVSARPRKFINCTFLQNTATLDGGAVFAPIGARRTYRWSIV
jgi:predicted outer membrane repeat protein